MVESKYKSDFLKQAHKGYSRHKQEITESSLCGCFYCLETFSPKEIMDWIEETNNEETALCAKCGIDSILSSKWPIEDPEFLKEMNLYWF
jgi:hypothetical protein